MLKTLYNKKNDNKMVTFCPKNPEKKCIRISSKNNSPSFQKKVYVGIY